MFLDPISDKELIEDKPNEDVVKISPSSRTKENIYIENHKGKDRNVLPLLGRGKKSASYHINDYMKKKIPLEKKIEERNQQTYSNNDLWKKIWIRNRSKDQQRITAKGVFYNHLTPNRDFSGFRYLYKAGVLEKKINKYYNNVVNSQV